MKKEKNRVIYLIESSPFLLESACELLEDFGFRVLGFQSYSESIPFLEKEKPDLVIAEVVDTSAIYLASDKNSDSFKKIKAQNGIRYFLEYLWPQNIKTAFWTGLDVDYQWRGDYSLNWFLMSFGSLNEYKYKLLPGSTNSWNSCLLEVSDPHANRSMSSPIFRKPVEYENILDYFGLLPLGHRRSKKLPSIYSIPPPSNFEIHIPNRKSAILIDSCPGVLDALNDFFMDRGFNTKCFQFFHQAIPSIESENPDFVMVELFNLEASMMGISSYEEVYAAVKKENALLFFLNHIWNKKIPFSIWTDYSISALPFLNQLIQDLNKTGLYRASFYLHENQAMKSLDVTVNDFVEKKDVTFPVFEKPIEYDQLFKWHQAVNL